MRVLFFSQHFPPEITAGAMRVNAIAEGLASWGNDVEVICAVPNHPQGVTHPAYRGRRVVRERVGRLRVTRVWVHTRPRKTVATRLANYASYASMATAVGSRARRPDVVIASSPPLPVAAAAAAVARRHRCPWVLDVRDLWPDIALVLGQLEEGPVLEAGRRLERFLYRDAAAITAVTAPFLTHTEERGGAGKVRVIQNGTTDTYLDAIRKEPDRRQLGLSAERFIWSYLGNLGLAQGLDAAVAAARLLGDEFELLLLGEGPMRKQLADQAGGSDIGHVVFHDLVPPTEAALYMRASDALLVPLADSPDLADYVPSKLFDCCAVGRPVILATTGESARLAGSADAVFSVPPGNADRIAAAVRSVRDDPELAEHLGRNARAFAEQNTRRAGVDAMVELLSGLVVQGR